MTQTLWRIFPFPKHHWGRLFQSLWHSGFGFVSDFSIRISGFNLKGYLYTSVTLGILLGNGFVLRAGASGRTPGTADLSWNGHFTVVRMTFNDFTHEEMWALYTEKLLRLFPTIEADYDAWLARMTTSATYEEHLEKLQYLRPQVPSEYCDEIRGMASQFSGGNENIRGDGRLSIDELYYVNLYVDIMMARGCSAISVFGPSSETGTNMVARLVDWYPRKDNAVFIIQNGDKSIGNISRLLSVMAGTAFNRSGVFAAILDGGSSPPVDFRKKRYRSTLMDIRYALENYDTLDRIAGFLSEQEYTFSHEIFLADPKTGGVLENNMLPGGCRSVRRADSVLGEGVTWEHHDAIAAVNPFFLKENYRGQGVDPRWTNLREQIAVKLRHSDRGEVAKITFDELKAIATFYDREGSDAYPGSGYGDIYNSRTQHVVLFEPATFHLELFFRNASPTPIKRPVFIEVPVLFHED